MPDFTVKNPVMYKISAVVVAKLLLILQNPPRGYLLQEAITNPARLNEVPLPQKIEKSTRVICHRVVTVFLPQR